MFGTTTVVESGTTIYDKKDQYDQIVPWMLPGEKLTWCSTARAAEPASSRSPTSG